MVTIINALNFMDNMDGLATSLSIVISLSLFILSYLNGQYLVAALGRPHASAPAHSSR